MTRFNPNTVLILGAGASAPYGFALMDELHTDLMKITRNIGTDFTRFLNKLGYSDGEISNFGAALKSSHQPSIDEFLYDYDDLRSIGTTILATYFLGKERLNLGFDGRKDWYPILWDALEPRETDKPSPVSAIITLNYERSLEYYFERTITASYSNSKRANIRNKINQIDIIHLHGSIGKLEMIPFGCDFQAVRDISIKMYIPSLKFIWDSDLDKSESYRMARDIIDKSSNIVFIGFQYHESVLKRLGLLPFQKNKKLYGTCFKCPAELLHKIKYDYFNKQIALANTDIDAKHFMDKIDMSAEDK